MVCNTEFLKGSGIKLGKQRAILVNERMQTSVKNIFAAGDATEFERKSTQLWGPAQKQGRVAGANMLGGDEVYPSTPHYFATRLFDLDFASVGEVNPPDGTKTLVNFPKNTGKLSYSKLFFKRDRLIGALMLGERSEKVRRNGRIFQRLISENTRLEVATEKLFDPFFNAENIFEGKPTKIPLENKNLGNKSLKNTFKSVVLPSLSTMETPRNDIREASLTMEGIGKKHRLKLENTIGRSDKNDIVLRNPLVSAFHARVYFENENYFAIDQGSTNGTWINDKRLQASNILRTHDELIIGTTKFLFVLEDEVDSQPTKLSTIGMSTMQLSRKEIKQSATIIFGDKKFPIKKDYVTVGRDMNSDISIQDPSISSKHAIFARFENNHYVSDLGTNSGTWVNRELIHAMTLLNNGDKIVIGASQLKFRLSGAGAKYGDAHPQTKDNYTNLEATLTIAEGKSRGLKIKIPQVPVTVGKMPESDVFLADSSVSRMHATINFANGLWLITDNQSSNKTLVNDVTIVSGKPLELSSGDTISFGNVSCLFTIASIGKQPEEENLRSHNDERKGVPQF